MYMLLEKNNQPNKQTNIILTEQLPFTFSKAPQRQIVLFLTKSINKLNY